MHWQHPSDGGFVKVSKEDLTEYLKTGNDYTRDNYSNCSRYHFKHKQGTFAVVTRDGECWVSPEILHPST